MRAQPRRNSFLDDVPRLAALFLALITLAVFWRVAGYPFLSFDDNHYVTENAFVRGGFSLSGLRWAFFSDDGNYWHPLAFVSHMLDVQVFGLRPGWHHLTNLALHLANVLLLFSLLRGLTKDVWRSAFVAAVFAVHPLQVESVAWIAERKTVLATLLVLLSLRSYAAWARGGGARAYWTSAALFAASLAAKPLGVALPALLLVLEFWPLGRLTRQPGRCLKAAAPFAALSVASCAATIASARYVSTVPLSWRLGYCPLFLMRYLGKAVLPMRLSVFYPYPEIAPPMVPALCAVWALAALTAGAWLARGKRPAILAGWLWFLAALLPVGGLVAVGGHSIADRFMYAPLIGLAVSAAWATEGWKNPKAAPACAAIAVVVALMTVAGVRLLRWSDSVALFRSAAAVEPASPVVRLQLGFALLQDNQLPEAEDQFRLALALRPGYLEARHYLGVTLAAEGRPADAAGEFRRALVDAPGSAAILNNLKAVEAAAEAELRARRKK
jgi:tetratricopeptide (TPR) repeat protein